MVISCFIKWSKGDFIRFNVVLCSFIVVKIGYMWLFVFVCG